MELRIIDADTLDQFVTASPNVHYMKTSMWADFKKQTDGDHPSFLGFYNGDTLAATAMVLKNRWMGHSYLYIPCGPCMDYDNEAICMEVFYLLKQYADKNKAQFLRIDPNVIRCHHEIDGTLIDDGFSNEDVTEDLKRLGYIHKGYGYAYNGSWTNRFTLIADLSGEMEEIISRYSKPRKTSLNRHKVEGVTVRTGNQNDISTLMELEGQLAAQDGFKPHSRSFFDKLLNCFGSHAVVYTVEINLNTMVNGLKDELNSKKYRKDPEAKSAKEKELVKAVELLSHYGSTLPIACGLFIRIGMMSWDLYTYNHKSFGFIKPVDSLHAFAMSDMKQNGVVKYDMCGFSGTASKDDPYYGLYAYKRSFGPEFIEQIGEFDYVRNPSGMKRFRFEKLAVNHLKRKWWSVRYLRKDKN